MPYRFIRGAPRPKQLPRNLTGRRGKARRPQQTLMKGQNIKGMLNTLLPNRYVTKLVYHDTYSTGAMTSTVGGNQFRANSLNDPDSTGVGHQARGYDQLKVLYHRARVTAVKIEVWSTVTIGPAASCTITVLPSAVTGPTTPNDMYESKNNKMRVIGNDGRVHYQKAYIPIYKIEGVKKSVVENDDLYTHTVDVNPAINPRVAALFASMDESSPTTVIYNVRLTYFCQFTGFISQDQS